MKDEIETKEIEIGSHECVIIDKIFGPQIFMRVRVTPDASTNQWIIERETLLPCPDPEYPHTIQYRKWVEWCRIPGQFKWEFPEYE